MQYLFAFICSKVQFIQILNKMEAGFIQRLELLKFRNDLNFKQISEIIGGTETQAKNYFLGRTKMPMEKVKLLASAWNVDLEWIISGKGDQPKDLPVYLLVNPDEDLPPIKEPPAPVYRTARAGLLTVNNQPAVIRGLIAGAIDELPTGQYAIFIVEGMSMFPSVCQGDKLLCRMVTADQIIDNRIHVVIVNRPDLNEYRHDGVWVKRVVHRRENGYVTCKSDNQDTSEPFPTFRLKTEEILEVWYPVLRFTAHMADPNRDIYERLDELESRIEMLEDEAGNGGN